MGRRRQSREVALQVLFQTTMTQLDCEEALLLYFEHFDAPSSARPFAEHLIRGVFEHQSEIDQLISSASEHWRIERMSIVDRSILRIALFEMLFCPEIPRKVSINEAVELGKTFGSEDSGGFINGILDHIMIELDRRAQREASSTG